MTMKFCSLLAGVSLVAIASAANAAQPLTNTQMDGVTAGAAAGATGQAFALGDFLTFTQTVTATDAVTTIKGPVVMNGTVPVQTYLQIGSALGQSFTQSAAASALFQAGVSNSSQSFATLP